MTDPSTASQQNDAAATTAGEHVAAEHQAHLEAEAVRLGRFMPLGMAVGAAAGLLAGLLTRHFDICVPVGIALGVFLAATVPVFRRRH
jgi:hypothetical protein